MLIRCVLDMTLPKNLKEDDANVNSLGASQRCRLTLYTSVGSSNMQSYPRYREHEINDDWKIFVLSLCWWPQRLPRKNWQE